MNMRGYKVVHNGRVYNAVEANPEFKERLCKDVPDGHINKPYYLGVWVINDDALLVLITDEARRFQFVRDLEE